MEEKKRGQKEQRRVNMSDAEKEVEEKLKLWRKETLAEIKTNSFITVCTVLLFNVRLHPMMLCELLNGVMLISD